MQHSQPPRQVEVETHVFELGTIECRHVDRETDLPAHQEVAQEPGGLDGDRDLCLFGGGAQVRRDHDQRMADQRVVRRRRLGLEDVDRRAGDLARLQSIGQCRFVDQPAPGAVDDPDRRLHQRDLAGADQVARLGRQRRVQAQEVAAAPEVVEPRDALDSELEGLVGRQERVEAEDRHAEALGPRGHREPDPAQADHAQRLAFELRAGEFGSLPFARLQTVVGLGDVSRQGQEQRHRVLGRRDRVSPRRIHDHDAAPGRGRDVDVVDAHARAHDRLQPRLAFQDLGRQLRARSNHDPVGLARAPCAGLAGSWASLVSTTTSIPGSSRSRARPSSASLSVTRTRCVGNPRS